MISLINGKAFTPNSIIDKGAIRCKKDKIFSIDNNVNKDDTIYDLKGLNVAPGFIDIHLHGGGGKEFWCSNVKDILLAAQYHGKHGLTSLIPTVNCSGPLVLDDEKKKCFDAFNKAKKSTKEGPELLGLHMEGPFTSPQAPIYGYKEVLKCDKKCYFPFLAYSSDIIRWTFAPENPNGMEMISELYKRGIFPSIGHSNATYEQVLEAYEAGAHHVTHLYSGMSMVHRINGKRYAGILEAAYLIDGNYVEVIGNGSHLTIPMLKLIYKIKGADSICIVSDATSLSGLPDGPVEYNGRKGIISDGVILKEDGSGFLGSAITYDKMFYNLVKKANIPMQDAIKMTSTTPAKSVGLGNRKGVLAPNYDADIIAFDDDINIKFVMARGKVLLNNL